MFSHPEDVWHRLVPDLAAVEPLPAGGRNGRLRLLRCGDGRLYAGKLFFRHPEDPRDRLGSELAGLAAAAEAGLPAPRLTAADREAGALVMDYLAGTPVSGPNPADVSAAVGFLAGLRQLAMRRTYPGGLPVASEACLSGRCLEYGLADRLARLEAADGPESEYRDMRILLDRIRREAARCMENVRSDEWDMPLPARELTLSPSDFGFHNCVRKEDGTLAFLDFEYFGWDDPAKTICDFVLHPGMDLAQELREQFLAEAVPALASESDQSRLRQRLMALYPLLALKWSLICLNEFSARDRARRAFAGAGLDREALARQLDRAAIFLEEAGEGYERFRAQVA